MSLVSVPADFPFRWFARAAPALSSKADHGAGALTDETDRQAAVRLIPRDVEKERALLRAAQTRLAARGAEADRAAPAIAPRRRRLAIFVAAVLAAGFAVAGLVPVIGMLWALLAGPGLAVHLAGAAALGGRLLRQAPPRGQSRAALRGVVLAAAALAQAALIAGLPLALGAAPAVAAGLALAGLAAAGAAFLGHARDGEAERLERDRAEAELRLAGAEHQAMAALARARAAFEAEIAEAERRIAPKRDDHGADEPAGARRRTAPRVLLARLAALAW